MTTPAVIPASAVPAIPVPAEPLTGLEDFDTSDLVVPRLSINHDEAVLVDSLTNEKFDKLDVILLGLVKQRVLWDTEIESGDKPLCRSYNHSEGKPVATTFPWGSTSFTRTDFGDEPTLDCESCALKDWDSHPQRSTSWCTEQYVLPLLILSEGDDYGSPAILTVQRSGIKPAKTYISGFARSRTPLYTVRTTVSLDAQRKGTVRFAVPKFVKGAATDPELWSELAEQYRSIREFVMTPFTPRDSKSDDAAPAASAPSTPAAAPTAPAASADTSDDIPF